MSREYYVEFGPRYPNTDGPFSMRSFVANTVASAIVHHGLKVRGPYKVRHHRGDWIQVFEFSGPRLRDVAAFYGASHELGKPAPYKWISCRGSR